MKIRFDNRAEKYLFYFVIVYSLFLCALVVVDNLGTDAGVLEYLTSDLFLVVIPLITVYKLPWEKRDLGFTQKETKIALVFLGIFIGLSIIFLNGLGSEPLFLLGLHPEPYINFYGALSFLSYPVIILLFVLARKQNLESVGITLKNFKNSVLILIIPFAYLIARISLSQFSMRSIGVIAMAALIVGISEEITWRGFPIFRLESLGKVAAVLITGVLFAAIHISAGGIPHFLGVLPYGLGWGLMSLKTRNILPLILLHCFADIV